MSVKESIIKNGVASLVQKGIKVAEQLLLIPFFIHYWGAAYYGEWITLTIIPSFLALSEFGFGTATANSFLIKYAAGEKKAAADIAKTGVQIMSWLILISIFLSIGIILFLKSFHVFQYSTIPENIAVVAVIILLIAKIIGFYQQIYEAYYRAARRASLSINFQTIISVANMIGGIIVLMSGGKIIAFALISLCISLLFYPLYVFFAIRTLKLNAEFKGEYDRNLEKGLINIGFGHFLSPIWQAIYYQGSTFVVRIILGPMAVTIFNTVRTLIRSSSQGFAMVITATYPDFQFELNAGNRPKALRIFLHALGLNLVFAIAFSVFIMLFGKEVYGFWTGNQLQVDSGVWLVFTASILFYALWFTFSFIFEALNMPYTYTLASLVCSILSVGISWVLSQQYNLFGASIANLCFDVLMCLYLLPKGAKKFNLGVLETILKSLRVSSELFPNKFKV
jgi:O-antigen/teichoic acid export membrane protein